MSPCYDPTKDMRNNIDDLAEDCYAGAKKNGFYDSLASLPWDILQHTKEKIEEAEQTANTEELMEELTDCIMILLGLFEAALIEHKEAVNPYSKATLGDCIRAKLKRNAARGHLHGRANRGQKKDSV